MSKKTEESTVETVELPAPPAGKSYRLVPDSHAVYVDCKGEVDRTFDVPVATVSEAAFNNAWELGFMRMIATGTTAAGKDESKLDAVIRRAGFVISDEYVPGAGGGGKSKSTYEKELYKLVLRCVQQRRADTDCATQALAKVWMADSESLEDAYRRILDAVAAKHSTFDPESQFTKLWPGFEKVAQEKADIIDSAKRVKLDADPIAASLAA